MRPIPHHAVCTVSPKTWLPLVTFPKRICLCPVVSEQNRLFGFSARSSAEISAAVAVYELAGPLPLSVDANRIVRGKERQSVGSSP
jgi:hypothetical protein